MKNKVLFLIVFTTIFSLPHRALSQELKFKKWEVGTDLLWLLKKNRIPLLYLANIRKVPKKKGSGNKIIRYRFRAWFDLKHPNETGINRISSTGQTEDKINYSMYFRLGYSLEKKKNKLIFNYGLDGVFEHKKIETETKYAWNNLTTIATLDFKENYYGISPFMELAYPFNSWMKISTEANLDLLYRDFGRFEKEVAFPDMIESLTTKEGKGFYIRTNPFFALNLVFKL